ncbi:hypothetical protein [Parasphingopyxis sp.]|uniref:hypothetical protein n=1 Tax=Parasphingopyxis sp. TaxID=1920299 RepID=UPI00260B658B|nr:hypothetical protein [Parasphingopyxis sp.]
MSRYRSKPCEIEAVQITAADFNGKSWDGSPFSEKPDWLLSAIDDGRITVAPESNEHDYAIWHINTIEGEVIARPGHWIILGMEGELYPCKPSVFERRWEKVT